MHRQHPQYTATTRNVSVKMLSEHGRNLIYKNSNRKWLDGRDCPTDAGEELVGLKSTQLEGQHNMIFFHLPKAAVQDLLHPSLFR